METIGTSELWSFLSDSEKPEKVKSCTEIRKSSGHVVKNYLELAMKISALQFKNPEYVLLFRGQAGDHLNKAKNSSLKPSLFRPRSGEKQNPSRELLSVRYEALTSAEEQLINELREKTTFHDQRRIKRQRILRWALLQHYEVCPTPLLDVTHSLRIATSFASESMSEYAYIFVLGVPNISGSVTANAESGIQIVRLASVCPPQAVRPHIQEGYLLGEYPEMHDIKQKQIYDSYEVDFARRLIGKFRFQPASFWANKEFPRIKRGALYPDRDDPLHQLTQDIRTRINVAFGSRI